jgi:hypothetical protein
MKSNVSAMTIKLTDLIQRVPPEVESKVKRVRDQARPVLQEALRSECRLVMRTPKKAEDNSPGAQVRVEVAPGYPVILRKVEFSDDQQRRILLGRYRTSLEMTQTGASELLKLRKELSNLPDSQQFLFVTEAELRSTSEWAASLLEYLKHDDPLKNVLDLEEDILGVYEYDASNRFAGEYVINRAAVRLYWGIIGLVAEWMVCTVEDLAIVVLTHELAHAYTQLGADIEGRRWSAPQFAKTEIGLKEGLAQYYTHQVLTRLRERYGGALKVFQAMLPKQHEVYRTHKPWVKDGSAEAVRRALLEVRRWKELKLEDFERRLHEAQEQLNSKSDNDDLLKHRKAEPLY